MLQHTPFIETTNIPAPEIAQSVVIKSSPDANLIAMSNSFASTNIGAIGGDGGSLHGENGSITIGASGGELNLSNDPTVRFYANFDESSIDLTQNRIIMADVSKSVEGNSNIAPSETSPLPVVLLKGSSIDIVIDQHGLLISSDRYHRYISKAVDKFIRDFRYYNRSGHSSLSGVEFRQWIIDYDRRFNITPLEPIDLSDLFVKADTDGSGGVTLLEMAKFLSTY